MESYELRLECIRLAISAGASTDDLIRTASSLFAFIATGDCDQNNDAMMRSGNAETQAPTRAAVGLL